jgi:hypothetical protein
VVHYATCNIYLFPFSAVFSTRVAAVEMAPQCCLAFVSKTIARPSMESWLVLIMDDNRYLWLSACVDFSPVDGHQRSQPLT